MARIEINAEACKSCSYCVLSCPTKTIEIGKEVNSKGYLYAQQVKPEKYIGCAMCGHICPESAIEVWK